MTREEITIIKTPEQKKAHKAYVASLKREEIREELAKYIRGYSDVLGNQETVVLMILDYLHSQGVVREVDTRWYVSNGKYLNPLTDKPVRVVAVEPLIEE